MEEGQRRPGVEQGRGGAVGDMMDVDGSDDVEQVSGGDTSVSSSTTTSTADPRVTDPIIPASPLNTPTTLGTTPATPQTRPASSYPPWLPPSSFTFPFVPLSPTSGLLYNPTTGTVYHISFPSPTGGSGAPTTTAQPRASPSAIVSLPPITHISPATLALHPHCPVCLEAFRRGDQTLTGPQAVVARKQVFHRACAEQWLERSNACPVCRWELPTGDAGYDVGVEERNGKRVEEWRRAHTAGTGTGVEAPVEAGAGGDGGLKGVPTGTKEIGWANLTLETVAAPTRSPLESIPSPDTSPTSTSSLQRPAFASRLPSIRIRSDTIDALPPAPTLYLPGCSYRFNTFCLSRSVRVRGWEDEAKLVEKGELDGVIVRCPVCRRAGTVEMVEEGSEEQGVWVGVGWAEAA
ncbi:hypothetical protein M427DRAFT_36116 [Gonapodya prolifera JEL478]|uniref:E3 ubiquitin-protein ligase RNF181 n=1 Tax=Gonapodya prolifera (strain JEL478) TaxID=1344416 RepID=A0A139A324_GONPJ|nr:hypothetical protein M427DRAFT_36116 [Gonapodya prolifera JEL478]|eukprot:KXS11207.1 hypothetical protein M427DRAFT_36116 [Gonapodya prolifera JEL478]